MEQYHAKLELYRNNKANKTVLAYCGPLIPNLTESQCITFEKNKADTGGNDFSNMFNYPLCKELYIVGMNNCV
jgi:hypothetical protein